MLTIRPADDADGPGLARLIAVVFSEYEGCPFVADEFPELGAPATHYRDKGGGLWVVEDDGGTIAGSLALARVDRTSTFELAKVYVARHHRGTGLAQRLWAIAEAEARARGARDLLLWTDTRFASGHRFYEKLGFVRQPIVRYLADATAAWEYCYRLDLMP
jgi:putative acetyltransferase